MLTRWQAYAKITAQKDFDILALDNMHRTFSIKVMFILLVTPFCCNVSYCKVPFYALTAT